MSDLFRIIDVNINRAAEGLRILEDIARFYYINKDLCENLKVIRHKIRKSVMKLTKNLLNSRDSINDCGFKISQELNIDNKNGDFELIIANFKRVQEAIRVNEELLKVMDCYKESKLFEQVRFDIYNIEKKYLHNYYKKKKIDLLNTDIYCITSHKHSNGRDNVEVVSEMLAENIKVIQYREKHKTLKEKLEECKKIRELTYQKNCLFIVNDDIHIAMMVEADGVHIGQEDFCISDIKSICGDNFVIGVSTHSKEQALNAVNDGADYIGVGPIYKTYTKENVCDPVGIEYLEYVVNNIKIPFITIGGIKEHNVEIVIEKGAKTVALVTEIVGAKNIREKIRDIREKIKKSGG